MFSVETWDKSANKQWPKRWSSLVHYGDPYSGTSRPNDTAFSPARGIGEGHRTTLPNNNSYIAVDIRPYYNPGWTFWAMPFGCIDTMDSADLGASRLHASRVDSFGCEGFYIDADGYAMNREYMVPAYNMSDYYQIFPTWSDGANVAGYRRDKVSPVSFLPAARLAHYRTWTYGAPDFEFRPSAITKRLVIVFHWDFSPRARTIVQTEGRNSTFIDPLPKVSVLCYVCRLWQV